MSDEIKDQSESILANFASLVESAPDVVPPPAEKCWPPLVSEKNGWGVKYIERIDLTGNKWLAMLERAKAAVEACGIVAFLGSRGSGKTQMAAEIARDGRWPKGGGEWNGYATVYDKKAIYRRSMDLFLDLRDAAKRGSNISEKDVLAKLEVAGLLVIDEFQERGETDWENRIVSNLIDKRYSARRPTILIANFTRDQMSEALSDSVKDRIRENGKRFDFDWDSYRAKP